MNYMTGILIDPFLKKVTNVNVSPIQTLQDMYKHIGCSMVEVVSFGDVNDLWVDEEGLMKPSGEQRFFKVHNLPFGHHGVIAGRALLLKCDNKGGTTSTSLTIEDVLPRISWDFTHNNRIYNSETGLFTNVEVVRDGFKVESDIVDSIKSIHVIE
mgnify:CR=1 FL=1|tara:strand:- start:433 stop:897 length:465 start_codon:yes stop_codon:yes gene_type:complete